MKKQVFNRALKLAIAIGLCLGVLICNNTDINAASLNKQIGTEYAKVVKQYIDFTNYFKTRINYYPTSSEYRKLKKEISESI